MIKRLPTLIFMILLCIGPSGAQDNSGSTNLRKYEAQNGSHNAAHKTYLNIVSKTLCGHFYPPPGTESGSSKCSFLIDKDGGTSSVKIEQAPLYKGQRMAFADRALKLAIENSTPLPKPPADFKCPTRLLATFDGRNSGETLTCTTVWIAGNLASDPVRYNER
jgi:hypothetical protein